MFGLTFVKAWIGANEAAKAVAATIAVGAKVVGQVPVIMAWKENAEDSVVQGAREIATKATVAVRKTISVGATEWVGRMDVKAAEIFQDAGLPVDAMAEGRQAALDSVAVQQEWEQKQAASNAALSSMRDKVNQANAQRSTAAQQLKQKIVGGGKTAADAINSTRKYVDALAVKGIVRSIFGIRDLYDDVKRKFTKEPFNSPETSCPDVHSPDEQLRHQITWQEGLLTKAKEAAKHGPNAAALKAAIPDLENHIEVSKKALLAADVYAAAAEYDAKGSDKKYHTKKDVAPGCDRLGDDEIKKLGLDPNAFHPEGSEFRAAIYKCGDRYTIVYKGTTPSSEQDWENNALQGLGLKSDYYSRAEQLAQRVYGASKGKLDIAGHSLGGGLASAAVASLDRPNVRGITFNPSGLNADTVPDADLSRVGKRIDAYRVRGEVLTIVQSATSAVGLSPEAIGAVHILPGQDADSMMTKHGMPAVEQESLISGANTAKSIKSLLGAKAVTVT